GGGPQRVVCWPVRSAAAELVVENDRPVHGEVFQRLQVVVRHAGAAMQAEQRSAWPVCPCDPVPDPPARDLDTTLNGGWTAHGCRLYPGRERDRGQAPAPAPPQRPQDAYHRPGE